MQYCAVAAVAVSDRAMPSSSQPTGCAGRQAATTAPTVAELARARTGTATLGKTNWTRSARLGPAQELVQPRHGGQAEAGSPATAPAPARPPAGAAGRSGGRRHGRGPGCSQRTTDPVTSHACQLPVAGPACVWAALRRTDRPQLALGNPTNQQHMTPCLPCHPTSCQMRLIIPMIGLDPFRAVWTPKRIQPEQPRSVWSHPDRRRASVS